MQMGKLQKKTSVLRIHKQHILHMPYACADFLGLKRKLKLTGHASCHISNPFSKHRGAKVSPGRLNRYTDLAEKCFP